jgi:hypothetical protein
MTNLGTSGVSTPWLAVEIGRQHLGAAFVESVNYDKGQPIRDFYLTRVNFCLVDAVKDSIGLAALRVFLLEDLQPPAYFKDVEYLELDPESSFYIWLSDERVQIDDDSYITIQDIGESLYVNPKGEWLMTFMLEPFSALGLQRIGG